MRKWIVAGVVALLVLLMTAFLTVPTLHGFVREHTQEMLQTYCGSAVESPEIDVTMFPRLRMIITGLVLRHKGRTDIRSLIEVKAVSMCAQPPELLGPAPYISFVLLGGLQIHTPPRVPGGEPLIRKIDASPEYVAALDKCGIFGHEPYRELVSCEGFMETLKREEMYRNP